MKYITQFQPYIMPPKRITDSQKVKLLIQSIELLVKMQEQWQFKCAYITCIM